MPWRECNQRHWSFQGTNVQAHRRGLESHIKGTTQIVLQLSELWRPHVKVLR